VVGVHAELDEVAAVEECGEAFAGGEQAFFVAFFDAVDAAADKGFLAALLRLSSSVGSMAMVGEVGVGRDRGINGGGRAGRTR
jgi:hypothetical protein